MGYYKDTAGVVVRRAGTLSAKQRLGAGGSRRKFAPLGGKPAFAVEMKYQTT
jgi:hypothetical protein